MRVKLPFVVTSVGILVLAYFWVQGWRASRALHETDARLTALSAKNAGLDADIHRVRERGSAATRLGVELTASLETLRRAKSSPATTIPKEKAPVQRPRTITELIAHDPKAEALWLERQRAATLLEDGPFLRALRLTSDQIQKFADNFVRREEQRIDLSAAGRMQDEKGKEVTAALQKCADEEYEAAQRELLGPDNYRRFQEYSRTVPLRNIIVHGFAGEAALEGIPLSAQQGERLVGAAVVASGSVGNESHNRMLETMDWNALRAQARQILSPAQFAIFDGVSPSSGFTSWREFELNSVVRQAREKDAAAAKAGASGSH